MPEGIENLVKSVNVLNHIETSVTDKNFSTRTYCCCMLYPFVGIEVLHIPLKQSELVRLELKSTSVLLIQVTLKKKCAVRWKQIMCLILTKV